MPRSAWIGAGATKLEAAHSADKNSEQGDSDERRNKDIPFEPSPTTWGLRNGGRFFNGAPTCGPMPIPRLCAKSRREPLLGRQTSQQPNEDQSVGGDFHRQTSGTPNSFFGRTLECRVVSGTPALREKKDGMELRPGPAAGPNRRDMARVSDPRRHGPDSRATLPCLPNCSHSIAIRGESQHNQRTASPVWELS